VRFTMTQQQFDVLAWQLMALSWHNSACGTWEAVRGEGGCVGNKKLLQVHNGSTCRHMLSWEWTR
jgi:hypothetical protein